MQKLTRIILVVTLLFGSVGCDQITKVAARARLSSGTDISFLHDTFRLSYAENIGAFLSLGESMSKPVRAPAFQGVVGLLTLGLLAAAMFWPGLSGAQVLAVALLGVSGLGNLIDRIIYDGHVTDFMNIGIGNFRTGIFNVADIFGVVAVVVLLVFRRAPAERGC